MYWSGEVIFTVICFNNFGPMSSGPGALLLLLRLDMYTSGIGVIIKLCDSGVL